MFHIFYLLTYFLVFVVVVVSFSMECFSCVRSKVQISLIKLPEYSVFLFFSFSGVIGQSPGFQRVDSSIQLDNSINFDRGYPLYSDLSSG